MKAKNNSHQEFPSGFMTGAQYKSFRQSVDEVCEPTECVSGGYKVSHRSPLRARTDGQGGVGVKASVGEVRRMSGQMLENAENESHGPPQSIKATSEDPVEMRLLSYARKYKAHKENLVREHNLRLQQELRPPALSGKSVSMAKSKEVLRCLTEAARTRRGKANAQRRMHQSHETRSAEESGGGDC